MGQYSCEHKNKIEMNKLLFETNRTLKATSVPPLFISGLLYPGTGTQAQCLVTGQQRQKHQHERIPKLNQLCPWCVQNV